MDVVILVKLISDFPKLRVRPKVLNKIKQTKKSCQGFVA